MSKKNTFVHVAVAVENIQNQPRYIYQNTRLKAHSLPNTLAGIPNIPFDRNSKRRQIIKQLGTAYREAGWSPDEAAKLAKIKPQLMVNILNGNHWFLTNDDLSKITKAIKVIEPNFIYLHDIRKHLDFLYLYCDVASDLTACNMREQQILEFIESDWRPERGVPLKHIFRDDGSFAIMENEEKCIDDISNLQAEHAPVTLQALPELRTFSLAVMMLDFVETNRLHLMDRLIQTPYFTNEVFRVFHELSKIPVEEIIIAKEFQLDSKERLLRDAEAKLKKIKNGSASRQDQIDKEVLIAYFKEKNHVIKNSNELENWLFKDWPLKNNYAIETLKEWYKEAMPHVRLVGGRPKKIK